MEDENRLIKERIRKLNEIREMKLDPYPYKYHATHTSGEISKKYEKLGKEEKTKDKVTIAGRLMTFRGMGRASFATLQDEYGKIQLYLREDDVGKDRYAFLKKLDLGDIIGASGIIFRTRLGEITVWVDSYELLCKSLRPLPEKYHGLKDKELRYRHRYVDLIMNPEVREVFRTRAKVIQAFREFLDQKGFLEVETPVLQPIYGGANAKPFLTHHNALNMKLYLRISDELYLKRLLVGGFNKVYEICKDFRNEGIDSTHNPEFTQLEWYEAYGDYEQGMRMFEELIAYAAKKALGTTKIKYQDHSIDLKPPWKRMSVAEGIKKYAKIDAVKMSREELVDFCDKNLIEHEPNMGKGLLIKAVFEHFCEQHLIEPTFVIDHPAETTPLCKPLRSGSPGFVERFEPYIAGMEMGNAYSELNDPLLQRKMLDDQVERGRGGEEETHPMDEDFLNSIEYGMPPTSGVGVGVDRVVMVFTDSPSIRDVILFPTMRPKE